MRITLWLCKAIILLWGVRVNMWWQNSKNNNFSSISFGLTLCLYSGVRVSVTSLSVKFSLFRGCVRTLKIYSFSNFQMYNIILLIIVTMLYIRFPGLIHLITCNLYSWINISPFPPIIEVLLCAILLIIKYFNFYE